MTKFWSLPLDYQGRDDSIENGRIPEAHSNKDKLKNKELPQRYTLVLMAFLAFVNIYMMKLNVSVALPAMVDHNSTQLGTLDDQKGVFFEKSELEKDSDPSRKNKKQRNTSHREYIANSQSDPKGKILSLEVVDYPPLEGNTERASNGTSNVSKTSEILKTFQITQNNITTKQILGLGPLVSYEGQDPTAVPFRRRKRGSDHSISPVTEVKKKFSKYKSSNWKDKLNRKRTKRNPNMPSSSGNKDDLTVTEVVRLKRPDPSGVKEEMVLPTESSPFEELLTTTTPQTAPNVTNLFFNSGILNGTSSDAHFLLTNSSAVENNPGADFEHFLKNETDESRGDGSLKLRDGTAAEGIMEIILHRASKVASSGSLSSFNEAIASVVERVGNISFARPFTMTNASMIKTKETNMSDFESKTNTPNVEDSTTTPVDTDTTTLDEITTVEDLSQTPSLQHVTEIPSKSQINITRYTIPLSIPCQRFMFNNCSDLFAYDIIDRKGINQTDIEWVTLRPLNGKQKTFKNEVHHERNELKLDKIIGIADHFNLVNCTRGNSSDGSEERDSDIQCVSSGGLIRLNIVDESDNLSSSSSSSSEEEVGSDEEDIPIEKHPTKTTLLPKLKHLGDFKDVQTVNCESSEECGDEEEGEEMDEDNEEEEEIEEDNEEGGDKDDEEEEEEDDGDETFGEDEQNEVEMTEKGGLIKLNEKIPSSVCFYRRKVRKIEFKGYKDGEFQWEAEIQSSIINAYYWGFLVSQIPAARLSGLFGGKNILLVGVLMSGIITLLTPTLASTGAYWLLSGRVILGVMQGMCLPATQELLAKWAPPLERTKMVAYTYSGIAVGTALGGPLSAYLVQTVGWRTLFYGQGSLALLWSGLWFLLGAETPSAHPRITRKEKLFILSSLGQQHCGSRLPVPWCCLLRSKHVLALMLAQGSYTWAWHTLQNYAPRYIATVLHYSLSSVQEVWAVALTCMFAVTCIYGTIADWLQKSRRASTISVRRAANSICSLLGAAFLVGVAQSYCNTTAVKVCFSLAISAALPGAFSAIFVNSLDLAPNHAATITAICTTFGTTANILSPYYWSFIVYGRPTLERWRTIWYTAAIFLLFANCLYFLMVGAKEQRWNRPVLLNQSAAKKVDDQLSPPRRRMSYTHGVKPRALSTTEQQL